MIRWVPRQILAAMFLIVAGIPLESHAAALWDDTPHGAAWMQFAHGAIDAYGSDLISAEPSDVATFCPNYAALSPDDRRTFWIDFLAALAQIESANNPSKKRWHFYNGDAGRPVISRGLFQISIESAHRDIYQCGVAHSKDLAGPQENITCAVRILSHWVVSDGVVAAHTHSGWRGAARYWHSLRQPNKQSMIAAGTAAEPACEVK